ncbi:phage tail sheath family protein [Cyclobacterium jeungdonense]|uniref:Phage tail sheath C-terminal domain-containing protein n=1 Tax=Cyclobacterium jeungdonense TaxID=708087 RepID=A0ABT8CE34_9BACT|nr:phage tail sheath C-terminal domain-containing protein [Cyclobacterium jeungdonense]MDN3689956.1 phage tail sheath C-terminal domain-containing protein [Cyclobacterium jeungdonense]
MAANYRTPGVYIEEISKFPPSVAQVETAIPAFIGYTEKAREKEADTTETLSNQPKRIVSLLEYETFFGGPEPETEIKVQVTEELGEKNILVEQPDPEDKSPFLMFYSLQAYFANGGGPCYIISVGVYADADPITPVTLAALNVGLQELEKEDEPTLILFPDATSLPDASEFYSLYNNALALCRKMRDRFTILDTYTNNMETEISLETGIREMITSDLEQKKYGAAYFPYLETILNYEYDPEQIEITHIIADASPVSDILEEVDDILLEAEVIMSDLPADVTAFSDANTVIQAGTDENAVTSKSTVIDPLQGIVDGLNAFAGLMTEVVENTNNVAALAQEVDATLATVATEASNALNDELEDAANLPSLIQGLQGHLDILNDDVNGAAVKQASTDAQTTLTATDFNALLQGILDLIDPTILDALLDIEELDMVSEGELEGVSLSEVEAIDSATYNIIKAEINKLKVILPPSSLVAGVYARVDSNIGVWKAPANVSLNYVVKPSVKITNDMQDRLNVDTIAGKSINAIRSFTGKGTLVWGARTLAGNDNEWRYVSVRRFFNMVEESTKKATEQFVFEPNDANTWVKVRAMIENFLIQQWRAGALAGAKPEHAFYVRIGLGQTMTAMDVLEGKMIVEIGMAVVRPAEFIILKFSHKMQES